MEPVAPKKGIEMKGTLPKQITMLELLLRDGLQHASNLVPTEAKIWYAEQLVRAGYRHIEVTNFGHPGLLIQFRDAEEVLEGVCKLKIVQQEKPHLKCYAMTRKAFANIMALRLAEVRRRQRPMVLAIIDLDHFKQVNDQHGHALGDHVLSVFGKLLSSNLRQEDAICRWGGDEFVVAFHNQPVALAARVLAGYQTQPSG